jgi:hypothetical protein
MTSILVAGGYWEYVVSTVERYDLAADRWDRVGSLRYARDSACAAAFDGVVYLAGGRDPEFVETNACERFQASDDVWLEIASLEHHRSGAAAVAHRGRLWVFGGFRGGGALTSVESYHPKVNQWTPGPPLPRAVNPVAATAIDDDLWVAGATEESKGLTWEIWSFRPPAGTWRHHGGFTVDRRWMAIAAQGRSFYFCGGGTTNGPTDRVERYDLDRGGLVPVAPLPTARRLAAAVTVGDRLFVMGGQETGHALSGATESLELSTGTWRTHASLNEPRFAATATVI